MNSLCGLDSQEMPTWEYPAYQDLGKEAERSEQGLVP